MSVGSRDGASVWATEPKALTGIKVAGLPFDSACRRCQEPDAPSLEPVIAGWSERRGVEGHAGGYLPTSEPLASGACMESGLPGVGMPVRERCTVNARVSNIGAGIKPGRRSLHPTVSVRAKHRS